MISSKGSQSLILHRPISFQVKVYTTELTENLHPIHYVTYEHDIFC